MSRSRLLQASSGPFPPFVMTSGMAAICTHLGLQVGLATTKQTFQTRSSTTYLMRLETARSTIVQQFMDARDQYGVRTKNLR